MRTMSELMWDWPMIWFWPIFNFLVLGALIVLWSKWYMDKEDKESPATKTRDVHSGMARPVGSKDSVPDNNGLSHIHAPEKSL